MSTKSGDSLATVLVAEVLLPIALAVLLSFVLAPPVRLLQRLYLPRVAEVTIVVLLAFGALQQRVPVERDMLKMSSAPVLDKDDEPISQQELMPPFPEIGAVINKALRAAGLIKG